MYQVPVLQGKTRQVHVMFLFAQECGAKVQVQGLCGAPNVNSEPQGGQDREGSADIMRPKRPQIKVGKGYKPSLRGSTYQEDDARVTSFIPVCASLWWELEDGSNLVLVSAQRFQSPRFSEWKLFPTIH